MPQFSLPRNASSLLLGLLMACATAVNAQSGADAPATVRLSPATRIEALPAPLSTALKRNLIEPFLAEFCCPAATGLMYAAAVAQRWNTRRTWNGAFAFSAVPRL